MARLTGRRAAACALVVATVALAASGERTAGACPAPTLSWYIAHSDTIVVARVIGEGTPIRVDAQDGGDRVPDEDAPDAESGTVLSPAGRATPASAAMTAVPVRVLKGDDRAMEPIELALYGASGRPCPAADAIGRVYLVFLDRGRDGRVSVLHAREIDTFELERSYAALVSGWMAIPPGDGDDARAARVEWAIECFGEPAARHDAVRELVGQLGAVEEGESVAALTGAQRARLFEALASVGPDELYLGIELACVLAPLGDDRVEQFARRALRDADGDGLWVAVSAMELLSDFYDWRTGRALAAMARDTNDESELRAIIARFEDLAAERREDAALLRDVEPEDGDDASAGDEDGET